MSSEIRHLAEPSSTLSPVAVQAYVRSLIAQVAEVPEAALEGADALRDLHLDSLTRMNVTLAFERDLGEMPPTLMFEHHTVEDLARHFAETRSAALRDVVPGVERVPQRKAPPGEGQRSSQLVSNDALVAQDPSRMAEDIAVVAVTGRYPGATDTDSLWRNLRNGISSITEVPPDRWDWRSYFDAGRSRPDTSYGRWGGFIDDVADFDAEFFGILPSDAVNIDPQERLFLHTCWDLLEQAGRLGASHQPSTGVFVGTMNAMYGRMGAAEWPAGKLTGANSAPWSIANRVSYVFDFHGPSFAVDSACSASLLAVHLACESLRRGECEAAIAGGVNLILHPAHLVGLSATGMLASGDACRVFDATADGYVPGEGVGAVLLKPLAVALADNDHVWGVIKGGAVNTAGRTSGFTVPDPAVQADLVTTALRRAGLSARDISFVEAHGTGTELGDPIETAGLARALEPGRPEDQPCAVGSVKANIGHLEGAAGIAGLTKVLLQMKHREIAPCANLDIVNPKISGTSSTLHFPRSLTPWRSPDESGDQPVRAGVSSFGAGGANVHLIVEEFISRPAAGAATGEQHATGSSAEHLVLLSARTAEQLRTLAAAVAKDLAHRVQESDVAERLAYSTQVGRREMAERLAVCFSDITELRTALEQFADARNAAGVFTGSIQAGRHTHQLDDEDDQAYVAALIEKRRLAKLARLWTDGVPVPWSELWTGYAPKRLDLPPYPFNKRRYWAPAAAPAPAEAANLPRPVPAVQDGPVPVVPPAGDAHHRADVEGEMRMAACGFLLVDPNDVDIDADLMELGFDSVSLVQLMLRIQETYGVELEPVIVFDYPNLRAIAGLLVDEHADAVAAHTASTSTRRH
jgi:acyl transferase domain-containing protein/acyl carrier protein